MLSAGGVEVAKYAAEPVVDPRHGPRPFLYDVRTLAGVPVTDVSPEDHPWHLGVSVAMPDVNGVNLWGGRTYVRDKGYTWLDDHGAIVHTSLEAVPGGFAGRLEWRDRDGRVLLTEQRSVSAAAAPGGWELRFGYALSSDAAVTLGSPATNGRPGGAGYGGFFWRAAAGPAVAFTATAHGEEAANGSGEQWLALHGAGPYTLIFEGLRDADRWFVRTARYPGVCAAPAFERPLVVPAGGQVRRDLRVLVADGHLTRDEILSRS